MVIAWTCWKQWPSRVARGDSLTRIFVRASVVPDLSGPGEEHAEQSTITINLGGFTGRCGARLQWSVALVYSPLPQGWLELEYLDFKQTLVELFGHQLSCTGDKHLSS